MQLSSTRSDWNQSKPTKNGKTICSEMKLVFFVVNRHSIELQIEFESKHDIDTTNSQFTSNKPSMKYLSFLFSLLSFNEKMNLSLADGLLRSLSKKTLESISAEND